MERNRKSSSSSSSFLNALKKRLSKETKVLSKTSTFYVDDNDTFSDCTPEASNTIQLSSQNLTECSEIFGVLNLDQPCNVEDVDNLFGTLTNLPSDMKPGTPPRTEGMRSVASPKLSLKHNESSENSTTYAKPSHGLKSHNVADGSIRLNSDSLQKFSSILNAENNGDMTNVFISAARQNEQNNVESNSARKSVKDIIKQASFNHDSKQAEKLPDMSSSISPKSVFRKSSANHLPSANLQNTTTKVNQKPFGAFAEILDNTVKLEGSPSNENETDNCVSEVEHLANITSSNKEIEINSVNKKNEQKQDYRESSPFMQTKENESSFSNVSESSFVLEKEKNVPLAYNKKKESSPLPQNKSGDISNVVKKEINPKYNVKAAKESSPVKTKESSPSKILRPVVGKRAFTTEDPDLFEKRSSRTEFEDDTIGDIIRPKPIGERGRGALNVQTSDKINKRRSRSVSNFHFEMEHNNERSTQLKKPSSSPKPSPQHNAILEASANTISSSPVSPTKLSGIQSASQADADVFNSSDEEATHKSQMVSVKQRAQQMQKAAAVAPVKQKSPSPRPVTPKTDKPCELNTMNSKANLSISKSEQTIVPYKDGLVRNANLMKSSVSEDAFSSTFDSVVSENNNENKIPGDKPVPPPKPFSISDSTIGQITPEIKRNDSKPFPPPKPALRIMSSLTSKSDDRSKIHDKHKTDCKPQPPPRPKITELLAKTVDSLASDSITKARDSLNSELPNEIVDSLDLSVQITDNLIAVSFTQTTNSVETTDLLSDMKSENVKSVECDEKPPLPPRRVKNDSAVYDNNFSLGLVPEDELNRKTGYHGCDTEVEIDLETIVQHPETEMEQGTVSDRYRNVLPQNKHPEHHYSALSNFLDAPVHKEYDIDESNSEDEEKMKSARTSARISAVPEDDANAMPKHRKIAMELLSTERSYVKNLELIAQVYYMAVIDANRKLSMFPDGVCQQMFLNIKSIYLFHNDFLLKKLETAMARWDEDGEKIGETMKVNAPFLKMYVEYINNFDSAITLITQWSEKSKPFADLLLELQHMPESGKLTLQHHMLGPVQRIPRYQLLLQDYVKHLPEDSPDLESAKKALDDIIKTNIHSNEAQKKIERFKKLIEINEMLGIDDLIGPTQFLIKEGRITKISARSGLPQERYLYLFSEVLLLCQPLTLGIKQQYRLKARLDVAGMQVMEGSNLEIPDTFVVKSKQLSLELLASSVDEKEEWHVAIANAINDYNKKQLSRMPFEALQETFREQKVIGKMAPVWIHDQDASMCMKCSAAFTFFVRRHHCRGCGVVTCDKCSEKRAFLEYLGRPGRVCVDCFKILSENSDDSIQSRSSTSSETLSGSVYNRKKVLEVSGIEPSLMCGYMHWSADCKRWSRLWFAVHKDFVLFSFKAHQDVKALNNIPLPGYQVEVIPSETENIFKIHHPRQTKYFKVDDKDQFNKWMSVLQKVVKAELPESATNEI